MSNDQPKNSPYFPALDGLRALAVFLIIGVHGQWSGQWLGMGGGSIGVDIFFVISGFLITRVLRDVPDLKGFYARRFIRLFPPLALLCLCFALYHIGDQKLLLTNLIPGLTYTANYLQPAALPHLWSLAVEEQFYLLWPLLLLLVARRFDPKLVLLLILAAMLGWRGWLYFNGASEARLYNGIDTHGDGLVIGCLLALVTPAVLQRIGSLWPLGLAAIIGWVIFGSTNPPALYQLFGFTVVAGCAATLVAGATHPNRLTTLLSQPPLRWLGRLSYGIYLWHLPLMKILNDAGFTVQMAMLIAVPLTIGMAALSYYGLEQPLLAQRYKIRPGTAMLLASAGPILLCSGLFYAAAV